jgi:glycosyltransferase involved in cell wall biosynthesis
MKLAIVHDWFVHIGGAERVLIEMNALWPEAPIYFLIADKRAIARHLPDADVRIARLGSLPLASKAYPYLAWAMPSAVEGLDLSAYDTVLSSSVLFSKGAVVRPNTRHISYCYSPSRMLWDRAATYERRGIGSAMMRHLLRSWDASAAQRPDTLAAISQTVADRISKYWRRTAIVIPPPIRKFEQSSSHGLQKESSDYFLIVSRLVPHKMLSMAIDAFNKTRYQLVIVGDGPLRQTLRRRAHTNIRFLGWQPDDVLHNLYKSCQAVIVPNDEDFGLTAVEAMAHGTPVLALRSGGATETVLEGITGEFFNDPIPEALADGVRRIKKSMSSYNPNAIEAHAQQWSHEKWALRMKTLVESPS